MKLLLPTLVAATMVANCTPSHSKVHSEQNTSNIEINLSKPAQTFEGWGAGLSWWASVVGQTKFDGMYSDLFFTDKTVEVLGKKLPGLNLNLARYNIGGGGDLSNGERQTDEFHWWKDVDGFQLEPIEVPEDQLEIAGENETVIRPDLVDLNTDKWDWSRDAHQRHMLDLAQKRNVDTVEFVAHAPLWWMNDSQSSQGGRLLDERIRDHAHHLAQTIRYAEENWNVKVSSVEPFNEPVSWWWNYGEIQQEGILIPREQQVKVLKELRPMLDGVGKSGVKIAASDENIVDQAIDTYKAFKNAGVDHLVDKVNVHSYHGLNPYRDNGKRKELRQVVPANKRIWMTEYGDGDGSGMDTAQTITEDLKHMKASAWFYWQPLEPYSGWGLINGEYEDKEKAGPNLARPYQLYNKYYVFAHYTRFIKPGFQLFEVADENTTLAYSKDQKQLVVVTYHRGPAKAINIDLSALGLKDTKAALVSTHASSEDHLFINSEIQVTEGKIQIDAETSSIYTIVIDGVNL